MSSVEISRVLAEMRALAARSQGAATPPQEASGFGSLLKQSIDAVDAQRHEASRLAESFEVGATNDLASVMIALVYLYWVSLLFVFGGELNAAIMRERERERYEGASLF